MVARKFLLCVPDWVQAGVVNFIFFTTLATLIKILSSAAGYLSPNNVLRLLRDDVFELPFLYT